MTSASQDTQTHNKRKLINRSAIGLVAIVLGLSTTTATLAAFVNDQNPVQQIFDLVHGTGGNTDVDSVDPSLEDSVDDYLRQAEALRRAIANKNISGIFSQVESILGQLGILSPRDYPGEIGEVIDQPGGSAPGPIPGGTPETPERIYEQQQMVTDTANSDQVWIHSDSVLGKGQGEGQTRLDKMKQISLASSEAANRSYESSASQSEQAFKNAELAQGAADSVDQLGQQAQQRTASQDVLKDLASQQSGAAKTSSAIASQMATLSGQQAIAAGQMSALSAQSQVANDHLTELQVGQTIGNVQLHDIFNAQRHANHLEVMEQQKNAQLALGSTDAIYIPGFLPR